MIRSRANRVLTPLFVLTTLVTPLFAQNEELEAIRHRIEDLLAEADHIEAEADQRIRELRLEAERLGDRLREASQRNREQRTEREVAQDEIEIMRVALHALREAERADAAEQLEHAIHARELALEGRRGDEAVRVRETAPDRRQQIELLTFASRLWDEFGHEEKAQVVAELAQTMTERQRRRNRAAQGRADQDRAAQDRADQNRTVEARGEREQTAHELGIMRIAMTALREGDRRDAADVLERAIHARELALEGRRGDEAMRVRRQAPTSGAQAEVLALASRLWAEFGHEEKARAVGHLAEQFGARARREAARREPRDDRDEQIDRLSRRLEEMSQMLRQTHEVMNEMRLEIRRLRSERDE